MHLIKDINIRHIAEKSVPYLLHNDQKQNRLCTQGWMQDKAKKTNFLSKFITGDESWIDGYDPETKQQSSQWMSPSTQRQTGRQRGGGKAGQVKLQEHIGLFSPTGNYSQ
jgi:hypothetical protein